MMTLAAQLLTIVPMPALAFVAMSDVAARRVPNPACAFIGGFGLATRIALDDVVLSLLAATLVFAALFLCFARGWCGGGDVKLLAACSLLVPAYAVPNLILTVAVAGGVLGLGYLAGRSPRLHTGGPTAVPASFTRRVWRIEAWRIRRHAPLPYACAIAAGCVFTLATG